MKQKFTTYHITILAFAIVVNIVGGQIALMLRLPIYLDSMGTILTSILYGPVYGMLTSLLSGIILGITVDSYALYFAPAGMLFGLLMGILWKKKVDKTRQPIATFPPVKTRISSALKKIPEPITIPMTIAIAISNPYFLVSCIHDPPKIDRDSIVCFLLYV